MRFRYNLIHDCQIWKISCDINDTLYDSIITFYNWLDHDNKLQFQSVLRSNLYHKKKMLPLQQPVKNLFNVKNIPIINTF